MKKMKSIFFMLLIVMSMMCTVVYAEPTAAPADTAATTATDEAATDTAATAEPVPTEAPTPEPTVAPELAANQIDAKAGVTEVIFKVKHTDVIDVSIISPSNAMLNTSSANVKTESVAGGTVITVTTSETGVWTINPSSTVGEEITVESECSYNFVIDLMCEKEVIYNGVSSRFFAFVKSKDGTNVDPNILRTSTMTLYILEEGEKNPSKHEMTFKGAAYETSYTYNDVGRLSIWAVAEINGAEMESEKLDVISILDPNEGGSVPIWAILLIVIAFTAAGVILYIRLSDKMKNTKGSKNMSGTVTINIAVNGDEKLPINRNLAMLGTSVGMLNIIGDDEYYDVDGITITGGENGLRIINKSRCDVRYSNVGSDPNGVTLLDGQYFKIFMPDEKTIITVTYHSEDIFTSLLNTAAAEQQKKEQAAAIAAAEAITAEELFKEFDNPEEAFNTSDNTSDAPEAAAEQQTETPVLESLNLSDITEDAVPEVQAEEVSEMSDEAVEETASFTIDTSDAEETPAADEEEYTFEAIPALEGFSFADLETELADTTEEAEQPAEETTEETASFTIDTSDAEETPTADEEEYTFEAIPALEGFSFADLETELADTTEETVENTAEESTTSLFGDLASLAAEAAGEADTAAEPVAPKTVIEDSNEALSEHFANLASLAQEAADEAEPTAEATETTSLFGDLASLAAEAAGEADTTAEPVAPKTVIEDSNEALSEHFANLQSLADELTKE